MYLVFPQHTESLSVFATLFAVVDYAYDLTKTGRVDEFMCEWTKEEAN